MHTYLNIALFPRAQKLSATLIDLASKNLRGQTEQYLLGPQCLPHISLCQLQTTNPSPEQIWSLVANRQTTELAIRFSHIYILPGYGELHKDKKWVGLSVKPSSALIDLQSNIYDQLAGAGGERLTDPALYFPHLTFGRLARACAVTISTMPATSFWQADHAFEISLGRSDKNGVYIERLY